tara:strand:+ start:9935 stop:11089 length:1155 start_codon:yes stop_codon:yes gene_type:complete
MPQICAIMASGFTFLHSADLHLGRRFGTLPEDIRGRLAEARHQSLDRLAQTARAHGARDILLAGDTFDTETPSHQVWHQARAVMAASTDLHWWILPGNHDSLSAELLWPRLIDQAPPNLHVIDSAAPMTLAPGVTLLPAPLPQRRPSHDLTAWMDTAPSAPDAIRIGLAHGAVTDFSSDGDAVAGIIPPDRARLSGLDYLALGDWHGHRRLGDRTAYAGTPENDGFRHAGRGGCLIVTAQAGAPPRIERIETGQFHWSAVELALVSGQNMAQALGAVLPSGIAARRDHLLRVLASGRIGLFERQTLSDTAKDAAPGFAFFDMDMKSLQTEIEASDLSGLDHGGALRHAAEALAQHAQDDSLPQDQRQIAAAALSRLFAYLRDDA